MTQEEQSDWAHDLLEALGDSTTSVSSVTNWLRTNLGLLNYYLSSEFDLSEDGEIIPTPNDIQIGIYNEMYICHWLRKRSIVVLGSMEHDWIEMEGEDQGRIKRVSHKEKSQVYQSMAKDCDARLKDLVKTYRGGSFAHPRQITFNERYSSPVDINLRCFNWSETNPVNNQ